MDVKSIIGEVACLLDGGAPGLLIEDRHQDRASGGLTGKKHGERRAVQQPIFHAVPRCSAVPHSIKRIWKYRRIRRGLHKRWKRMGGKTSGCRAPSELYAQAGMVSSFRCRSDCGGNPAEFYIFYKIACIDMLYAWIDK